MSTANALGYSQRDQFMPPATTTARENQVPLCVDLDGTLIRTDMLWESLVRLLRKNPLWLAVIPFWWMRGRACLKQQLARRVTVDVTTLPYHEPFHTYLRELKRQGRPLILATASDQVMADRVARHVGLFDEVLASNGERNLRAATQATSPRRKIFENLVAAELYKTLTHRGEAPGMYFWRTAAGVEVDLIVEWQGKPVWIVRRTKEMLATLGKDAAKLADPDSKRSEQPDFARNEARSLKPEYMVMVGICTHLGCSPTSKLTPGDPSMGADWPGGFLCPCHGSKFDLAGRVYANMPAPDNLPVPRYKFLSDTRILIGEDTKEA